jgi:hypothetical protein
VLTALHVPHCESGARAQNALEHCASSPQGDPLATVPGSVVHAPPSFCEMKSEHEIAGKAAAQASVLAGVALVPGNENVCAQPSANRVLHVATSPYPTCNPNEEQVCNWVQNASATSAHAFVASADTAESEPVAESDPPVPPSDDTPPPSEPNAPVLLDDEHAAMEKTTDAKIRTARFTKTSSQ